MPKGYFISCYRSVSDPDRLAAYSKLALPAIQAAGGRPIVRGIAADAHEAGQLQRTVIFEFDSLEAAQSVYATPAYQEALRALGDGAVRDIRIVQGVD